MFGVFKDRHAGYRVMPRDRTVTIVVHGGIRSRATAVGANTEILVDVIMRNRPHPEQGFRSCIGILRLAKTYGSERLEAACERALEIDATSYSSVASILKNKLERRAPRQATDGPAIDHPNIRGPQYFH